MCIDAKKFMFFEAKRNARSESERFLFLLKQIILYKNKMYLES